MDERGVAAPVLGRRIDGDDLRYGVARLEAGELRAARSGHAIERGGVGEREQAPDGARRVQGRLTEALIELAAPSARDVGDDAVEHLASGFVLVQAQIEQVAQESAGLRHADHVGALELAGTRIAGARRARPKPGCRVAHGEEPEADEGRVLGPVDELVDLPRLEPTGERDVRGVGEPPRRPRDGDRRRAGVLADGQARRRIVEVGSRLGDVVSVGHRQGLDARVGPPLAEHRTADRPVVAAGHRHGEREETILARDVVLPAAPRDRVAVPHQEPVAELLRARRVGHADGAVEHPQRDLAAAVRDVEKEPAVAARRIDGPQQIEVRGGLDEPGAVARRQGQIRDGLVRLVAGIDAQAQDTDDLLVGARFTERPALQDDRAPRDLERRHGHGMAPSGGRLSAAL